MHFAYTRTTGAPRILSFEPCPPFDVLRHHLRQHYVTHYVIVVLGAAERNFLAEPGCFPLILDPFGLAERMRVRPCQPVCGLTVGNEPASETLTNRIDA